MKMIKFKVSFFIKVITRNVNFPTGLTLGNLELQKSVYRLKSERIQVENCTG
jgi:hypothetical protein